MSWTRQIEEEVEADQPWRNSNLQCGCSQQDELDVNTEDTDGDGCPLQIKCQNTNNP